MEGPTKIAGALRQDPRLGALRELNERIAALLVEYPTDLITIELSRAKQILSRLACELGLADEIV